MIRSQPGRYGDWHARQVVAGELVTEWNLGAAEKVTRQSRKRLVDEEARLRGGVEEAAVLAVAAAQDAPARSNDEARLRAAWKPMSTLDDLAEAWRPVYALVNWVHWSGR